MAIGADDGGDPAQPNTRGPADPRGPASGAALGRSAVRASAWVVGGYAASQLLRFAGNLVLARLLFPDVFGLASLITVFLQGLTMFSDVGMGPAIVQSPRGDDPRFLDTAWTISCIRGVVLWAAACVLARPFASFYGEPLLAEVLPVAGLTALVAGLESTSLRAAQRHLRAGRVVAIELGAQAVNIVAIVSLVLVYRSIRGAVDLGVIWAVVAGGVASSIARAVLSFVVFPGARNRFRVERESARLLFGFGRWVFVSTILTFLSGQSDRLLFGKLVPLEVLGVYGIALNLSQVGVQVVQKVGSLVLFPAYSRLAAAGALEQAFRRARLPLLLGGAALASGFAACGPFLIGILYDARYAEAGWMLQVLAVGAWLQVLDATNAAALLAQGRVRWMAAGGAAKLATLVVLVPLGMQLGGFAGALAGLILSDLSMYVVSAAATVRRGLSGIAQDGIVTAGVAVVSYVGAACGGLAAAPRASSLAGFAGSAVPVLAAAVAAGLWYQRHERAHRAAPPCVQAAE